MNSFDGQSQEDREENSRMQASDKGLNERQPGESEQAAGGPDLTREEWDFSKVPEEEWMPALIWEMYREFEPAEGEAGPARTGEKGKMYSASTEKLESEFGADISSLLKAFARPWSCLPEEFTRLMANSYHYTQASRIVGVVSFPAAGGIAGDRQEAVPCDSDNPSRTTISLVIDWSYSRKKILARMAGILKRLEPANLKRLNLRGRKDRDTVVALERIGIMRLLHHFTLLEIKRVVPEAWRRYKTRNWYDDRRRVLKDFRAMVQPREPGRHYPRSWRTKGQSGRGT